MKITKGCDIDLWWEISKIDYHSTFFQCPIWHHWIQKVYPNYKEYTITFKSESGIIGVVPLLETGKVIGKFCSKLNSTYAGNYGGYLSESNLSRADEKELWKNIPNWHIGTLNINGTPFRSSYYDGLTKGYKVEEYSTHIVDFSKLNGNLTDIFTHSNRTNINKAESDGLTIVEANTLEDYRNYFEIYLDTQKRWGGNKTTDYPAGFFEVGYEMSQKYPDNIKLWFVKKDNQSIAGGLVFYWNEHVVAWHAASLTEYLNLRPNNYLHYKIMENAISKGYKYYDFNPSNGLKGVERFKEGFGAEKVYFQNLKYLNPIVRLRKKLSDLKNGLGGSE